MTWRDRSWAAINAVHNSLAADVPLQERTKAIDAAYPFEIREYFPYKAWLKARREYLGRYGYRGRGEKAHLSPMERAMQRSKRGEA